MSATSSALPVADTAHSAVSRGQNKKKQGLSGKAPKDVQEMSPPMTPDEGMSEASASTDAILPIPLKPTSLPSDRNIPDNYVTSTLLSQKQLPPITYKNLLKNINWVSFLALTVTPGLAIYGGMTTAFSWKTFWWSVVYYYITGLGITAGYHRLWAHRSYNASPFLQFLLAICGAGAVQGSIKWWSRGHRAHHRYTDTQLDPYSAHEGFWWAHVGWMIFKPRTKIGVADVSDLTRNKVVRWQHRNYLSLLLTMGFVFPTIVAGFGWGDWRGGFFFAGAARLVFVHHSTFCVNSLAHWLGDSPFDNKHTPRDHFITALVTIGEGYHNFHHQFPMDFRNAIKWFQYDPTKWFISTMKIFGLASHLKKFPDNEIKKGQYTMKLQKLAEESNKMQWPKDSNELPVVSWDDFQAEAKERSLILIHGFIHDVASFSADHPGGEHLIKKAIGTDATTAFFGGVYDHSNAAHNLLAMMRVGILDGGMEVEDLKGISHRRAESSSSLSSLSSSAASSDDEAASVASSTASRRLVKANAALLNTVKPPVHQPEALQPSKVTLSVPPSEVLRIVRTTPLLRPGLKGDVTQTMQDEVSQADILGEVEPMCA